MTARKRLIALPAIVVAVLGALGALAATALAASGREAGRRPVAAGGPRATVIDFVQISGVIDPPTADFLLRHRDG